LLTLVIHIDVAATRVTVDVLWCRLRAEGWC